MVKSNILEKFQNNKKCKIHKKTFKKWKNGKKRKKCKK